MTPWLTVTRFWTEWLDLLTPAFTIFGKLHTCLPWWPCPRRTVTGLDGHIFLLVGLLLWMASRVRMTNVERRITYEWTFFFESMRSESESCFTSDGQSASLLEQSTHLGFGPHIYYCQTVVGSLMWVEREREKERTGLSYTTAPGPCKRSHFGSESRGTPDIFYCLRFETSVCVASND